MKITPSFVLALAAASSVSASPLFKRQGGSSSSASNGLPTPSVASSASSAFSSATASRVSSTASSTATGTSASGSGSSNSSGTTQKFNDTQILQYALTLEHLEATFYNQSLSKLSASDFEQAGYNSTVRDQIYSIGRDEAAHVELLSKVLGNQSIPACTYNFSAVTDVESFLTTARVLEGVGVSAYLGASQNITNGTALVAAASILTVEGQHQSYLIAQTDDGGNAIPNPFATPLDFKQVYSLAAPFIESCPQNASLPITAFPSLTLSGGAANGSFTPGEQVTVSYDSSNSTSSNNSSSSNGSKYLAIIQGITGPQFVSLDGSSNNGTYQVTLPNNITGGQMYAVVTSSNTAVTDDNTLAGPAVGYVNIPLPEAPEATNTASSSSSSASMISSSGSSSATGGAGGAGAAGPTDSASSAAATATASGSDSIVSSASSTGSASGASATGSSTQSLAPSLASLGSASIPSATNN